MLNGAWLKRWLTGTDDAEEADDEESEGSFEWQAPVVRCATCAGVGEARNPLAPTGYNGPVTCWGCKGEGVLRAQYVITLVDLPTGRVASKNIIPGTLEPFFDGRCQGHLDVGAEVARLAATLNVSRVYQMSGRRWIERDLCAPVTWPLNYRSDRVVSKRWQAEYQAAAIARAGRTQPQLLLYSGVDLGDPLDPDQALRDLLAASSDLDLDLVVDVRADESESLRWGVCLAAPGSEIVQGTLVDSVRSLRRALAETSVTTALTRAASRSASGRWAAPGQVTAGDADPITWAELSARLTPLALPGPGAIGVYRRGEWFLSALETALDEQNDLKTVLQAKNPAPQPEGELIPVTACPQCRGAGCFFCQESGTELAGAVLTITDLQGLAKHVNWDPATAQHAGVWATASQRATASGLPLPSTDLLLDEHYSVGRQAEDFGVAPHPLRDLWTSRPLDRTLVDGTISRSASDPVADHVQAAARRRPAGRLIVLAGPEPEPKPPIDGLFGSILGLGLTLSITVKSAPAERKDPAPTLPLWCVEARSQPVEPDDYISDTSSTLAAAAARLQGGLTMALHRVMRFGRLELLPVPQQTDAVSIDVPAICDCLNALGTRYPDTAINLSRTGDLWTCFVGYPHLLSCHAETIDDVIAELTRPQSSIE